MTITLSVSKIYDDILSVSQRETEGIEDVNARFRVGAGSDKEGEIRDCIRIAGNRLEHICLRFLVSGYVDQYNNQNMIDAGNFVFEFDMGASRRSDGKAEPLAGAMHEFMVEYALARFYSNVSQGELSNKHSTLALDAGSRIEDLLYTKRPPRV